MSLKSRHNRPRAISATFSLTAAACAVALSACSSSPSTTAAAAQPASSGPVSGGNLTIGTDTEPTCYNPQRSGQQGAYTILRDVFETLIGRGANGTFVPSLAASWTISGGGTVYTFNLKHGVTFSDGEPFNATTVKDNLDFIANVKNAESGAQYLSNYDYTKVVNAYTAEVVLKQPDASLLESLSGVPLSMVAPSTLAKETGTGQECDPDGTLIGTGPFTYGAWQQGHSITLNRRAGYDWAPGYATHNGPAYLDSVTYDFLPVNAVRVDVLTSGQVDAIIDVPATSVKTIKADSSLQFLVGPSSGTSFNLNINDKYGAGADLKVRQALEDGFDLSAIVNSLYDGEETPATGVLGPNSPYYDAALAGTWGDNVAKANQLLNSDGWTGRNSAGYRTKDGKQLEITVDYVSADVRDNRDELIEAIASQLKQNIGLDLNLQLITQGQLTTDESANDWGIYPASQAAADPAQMMQSVQGPDGYLYDNSPTGGNDPQITAWLKDSLTTTSVSARAKYFDLIQQRDISQAYVIPLYNPDFQIAAEKTVHGLGFETGTDSPSSVYDVWLS